MTFLLFFLLTFAHSSDWIFLLQEDGIQIYGDSKTDDGLIPFKAVARLPFNQQKILKILMDTEKKPEWSPKLSRVKIHKKISDHHYLFSEFYQTPWPAKDREFLLEGEIIKAADRTIILKAKNAEDLKLANSDYIRADVRNLTIRLIPIEPNLTLFEFIFLGHMQGWMPSWLVNIIQKKWPLRFIQGLKKQLDAK